MAVNDISLPSPRLHIHRTTKPTTSTHPGTVELFSDFFYHVVFRRIFKLFCHFWTGVKRLTLHPRLRQVSGTLRGQLLSPSLKVGFLNRSSKPPNPAKAPSCLNVASSLQRFPRGRGTSGWTPPQPVEHTPSLLNCSGCFGALLDQTHTLNRVRALTPGSPEHLTFFIYLYFIFFSI